MLHLYCRGQGSNPSKPEFFSRFSFRNCISCDFNCDDLLCIYFFKLRFQYNFIKFIYFIISYDIKVTGKEAQKSSRPRPVSFSKGLDLTFIGFGCVNSLGKNCQSAVYKYMKRFPCFVCGDTEKILSYRRKPFPDNYLLRMFPFIHRVKTLNQWTDQSILYALPEAEECLTDDCFLTLILVN